MFALQLLSEGGEGVHAELLWVFYVLMGVFVLAILAGWLGKLRMKAELPAEEPAPDDLLKIEGVGTKVGKVLGAAGYHTFADLANAKAADVRLALNAAGLQMMNPDGWIMQAKAAAKGDWKKFEKLQKGLKGGRKK